MIRSIKTFCGFLPVLLVVVMSSLLSCKGDDPDPVQEQINKLTATWQLETVINDDVDVSSQFTGFSLTVDGTRYSTQNGGSPWPAMGTYELLPDNLNLIQRDDNTPITITEITTETLVLRFNFSRDGGVREGINGSFTFSLTK